MTGHHHDDSPESRYVCLHRAIEQDCATNEIWEELSAVCYRLGYRSEAARCASQIDEPSVRLRVETLLAQQGIEIEVVEDEPSNTVGLRIATAFGWKSGRPLRHVPIREEIHDAGSFLFFEHVPFTVMTLTLIFPLIVGLGGMLTAGTEAWVFPTVALMPVLCIALVVCAMARQILTDSAKGFTDAPRISDVPRQMRGAFYFFRDAVLAGLIFLIPGVLACQFLGTIGLPILFAGAALFPIAVALSQTREDLWSFHPKFLLPTAFALGAPGAIAIGAFWLAFTPAMSALWLTEGSAMYLRMSIVGPLGILPLFLSARLIGRMLFYNRDALDTLLWTAPQKICDDDAHIEIYESAVVASQKRSSTTGQAKRTPQHTPAPPAGQPQPAPQGPPQARQQPPAPQRQQRPPAPQRQQQTPAPQRQQQTPAPQRQQRPPAPQRQQRPPAPQQPLRPKVEHTTARPVASRQPIPNVDLDDIPGLSDLSGAGFKAITGDARVAAGAAARRPHG